jgi:hypothetical protein
VGGGGWIYVNKSCSGEGGWVYVNRSCNGGRGRRAGYS